MLLRFFYSLVVLSSLCVVSIFAVETPRLVLDTRGHTGVIRNLMFTHDGKYLVSASDDKTIRVWDVATGNVVRILRGEIGDGETGLIYAAALSPDDKYLAVGGVFPGHGEERYAIRVYDFQAGEIVGFLTGSAGRTFSLAFSTDSHHPRRLVSGGSNDDPTVRVWDIDARPMKQLYVFSDHLAAIHAVAFSVDGKRVASGSDDNSLILWDVETGNPEPLKVMTEHYDDVWGVAFSQNGRYLASGDWGGRILLWDANSGDFIKQVGKQVTPIGSLSFNPDSKRVLTCTAEGRVGYDYVCSIFSLSPSKPKTIFKEHNNVVVATTFSPDGKTAATGGGDSKEIYIWNPNNGKVIKKLVGNGNKVVAVGFGKDGKSIAFGNIAKFKATNEEGPLTDTVNLVQDDSFNVGLGSKVKNESNYFRAQETYQDYKLVNPRSPYSAVLYLMKGEQQVSRIVRDGTSGYVHKCYTFTHHGRYFITGAENGWLTLYDTSTGNKVRDFVGHINDVWSVAVSPDDHTLVSGSTDQTIKLWDIDTGTNLLTIFVGNDHEWVAWTSNGYYTSSLNGDKYIGWQVNQGVEKAAKYFTFAQFQKDFYRPDVVAQYLKIREIDKAVTEADATRTGNIPETNQKVLNSSYVSTILPPSIQLIEPKEDFSIVYEENLKIKARIKTGSGSIRDSSDLPITEVRVFLNGSPAETFKGSSNEVTLDTHVTLEKGINVLKIVASNAKASSEIASRTIQYEPRSATQSKGSSFSSSDLDSTSTQGVEQNSFGTLYASFHKESQPITYFQSNDRPEVFVHTAKDVVHTKMVDVDVEVRPRADLPIREIRCSYHGKTDTINTIGSTGRVKRTMKISLVPGKNDISVIALDAQSSSQEEKVTVTYLPRNNEPKIVFLGIGITHYDVRGLELNYAQRDADEMTTLFKKQEGHIHVESQVIPNLNDPDPEYRVADKQAINKGLHWLIEQASDNENAIKVIFLSGHGGLSRVKNNYYFYAEHHLDDREEEFDIDWRDLIDALTTGPAKGIFMVDTCHAAAAAKKVDFKRVSNDYHLNDLGLLVFTAADNDELSFEDDKWDKHGAFTYALIRGLKDGEADSLKRDGKISPDELSNWIKEEVPDLTKDERNIQHANCFNPGVRIPTLFWYR